MGPYVAGCNLGADRLLVLGGRLVAVSEVGQPEERGGLEGAKAC